MLEIQDELANTYASISRFGTTRLGGAVMTGGRLMIQSGGALVGIQVRDGGTGANIQEWQSAAGANLVRVSSTGGVVGVNGVNTSFALSSSLGIGAFYSQSATSTPALVRGAASQTANLQEWQNSAGSVVASVGPLGSATFVGGGVVITGGSSVSANGSVNSAGSMRIGSTGATISGTNILSITNGTAPSANPTSGGFLYVEAGALKFRGSSGTITTIANA
jgi:hypothetical protein